MFIKYLVLTILFLSLLIIFGEYYFFSRFNIEILNFDSIEILACSQRGLSHWEKCAFMLFLPFIITITFIIHFWIYETSTTKSTANIAFLMGILPFAFSPLLLKFEDMQMLLPYLFISIILILILWIMLFQIKTLQFSYLSIHLFLTCCTIMSFTIIKRIDLEAYHCLNSTKEISPFCNPGYIPANWRIIFIGSTSSFDLYYAPDQHQSVILPKTN